MQERIEVVVKSISGDLEMKRKLRRRTESLNKALARELAKTKTILSKTVKELESKKNMIDAVGFGSAKQERWVAQDFNILRFQVEGYGTLVPPSDNEVMAVEDILGNEKGEVPAVAKTTQVEGCTSNEEISSVKANLDNTEGVSHVEDAKVDCENLNACTEVLSEYIGERLQKVKQGEKMMLSSRLPDHSSDYMIIDGQCSYKRSQFSAGVKTLQTENSSQEIIPSLSRRYNDSDADPFETRETCLRHTDGSLFSGSSASASCSSSIPDFSKIQGEICLDSRSLRELQETFKATFGRETIVKDNLWLKRRIAMGLTNSCDVSTTSFLIKDNKFVKNKTEEVLGKMEISDNVNQSSGPVYNNCKSPSASPTNQSGNWQIASGKRSINSSEEEHKFKSEDLQTEQMSSKRARKPTRRYIEELSEAETREPSARLVSLSSIKSFDRGQCAPNAKPTRRNIEELSEAEIGESSVRLVSTSSIKSLDQGQSAPNAIIRPVCDVGSDGTCLVKRQLSLGGSGIQVPYVSRIRRGRPRDNFMPLMKYQSGGVGMAAKLVKKALGVHISPQDSESGQVVAETEKEKPAVVTSVEPEKVDSFGDSSDNDMTIVPIANSGARRKHHRAWSLGEVVKLVEGVSKYGAGRWSEIRRVSFASYGYRTSVDLKDKWRNLLRASLALAPMDKMKNARKHASLPIPEPILLRVKELAERHAQVGSNLMSTSKMSGYGGKHVLETRSGYL